MEIKLRRQIGISNIVKIKNLKTLKISGTITEKDFELMAKNLSLDDLTFGTTDMEIEKQLELRKKYELPIPANKWGCTFCY